MSGRSVFWKTSFLVLIALGLGLVTPYSLGLDLKFLPDIPYCVCTALVVGSDDVALSYNIGVLTRRQVGRREGGRGAREVASYEVGMLRSPAYQNRRSPSWRWSRQM